MYKVGFDGCEVKLARLCLTPDVAAPVLCVLFHCPNLSNESESLQHTPSAVLLPEVQHDKLRTPVKS